ncbi:MAG: class I SAM-dependent methyltransferase [Candidatus Cloacimonadota bacterium]|nr:class I SAM-dependent methyltransferase [Candidatus Cloacimonadota bacterium]
MNSQIKNWEQKQGVKFLSKIGVKKNFVLLDFGARIGHYSIPAALVVGRKGKVFALDKNESALDELKEKSEKLSLENIEIVKTDGRLQIDFPDSYFDAVLLYDILHFLSKNQRKILFTEILRVLKKDGLVSVYPKHINNDYPMRELENLTITDIIREIEEFGLDFSKKICETISHDDFLNYGCVINFKKERK